MGQKQQKLFAYEGLSEKMVEKTGHVATLLLEI